jgi:hypothetical protein
MAMSGYFFTLSSNSATIFSTGPMIQLSSATLSSTSCGFVLAPPRTRPTVVGADEFGSVVAGEDHDRVVANAQPLDGVEHLADVVVHLGQHVRPVAIAGLAGKRRVGERRQVRLRQRRVAKNGRFACACFSTNAIVRRVISASITRRCSTSYTRTLRLFSPLRPSMICSGGMTDGEYPGEPGHSASSVVRGMPYHSSKPGQDIRTRF